jgi:hypothetical protein
MTKGVLPQVGDVIKSIRFVYVEKKFDEYIKRIVVGRDNASYF